MMREMTQEQFCSGVSRLAGAVAVVATGRVDQVAHWRGMTTTAVSSLCADPPSLVVCLNRRTGTYQRVKQVGLFSVNLLSTRHLQLAKTFGGYDALVGPERFAASDWKPGALGVPVLADALATYECRIERTISHGTHALLLSSVEAASWTEGSDGPLVHHHRRFHDLGSEITLTGGTGT
jgi:flavin reductase (DIM6/NTAB) family NADH-FMN oxidoreductase RutF